MEIYYNNKKIVNDEFLKPSETQIKPEIKFNLNSAKYYTLIMYDPDAVIGTFVHWLVTNINKNNINNGKPIFPYKGPAPPPNTGKHRYIFELYEQNDMTNEDLPNEKRSISINELRNALKLSHYNYKMIFISKNESGGGKRKRTKKINKIYKNKTKKQFLYNPKNPKKSFDVYIDKNPKDTIHIKYTTLEDVKNTIDKLEKLYKNKKYTHKRIWQVGMILKVRLKVLEFKKPKQYALANKYFKFLGKRTELNERDRYNISFHY